MSDFVLTDEHREAFRAIDSQCPCVLIAGKAGVGKSKFTEKLQEHLSKLKKNFAVVAPTGGAALIVGGSTINSFFNFPFGVLAPGRLKKRKDDEILKSLQYLFIDEISMTRCDVIDAIDLTLRRARSNKKPFGGVVLILIGDLYQLPPVVTDIDRPVLDELGYTQGHYFFNAHVFRGFEIRTVELTRVFRVNGTKQSDTDFKHVLNKIREGEDKEGCCNAINAMCYSKSSKPSDLIITLATTNKIADAKNQTALASINEPERTYEGKTTGDFILNGANLPSPSNLVLKVGATVMFTANDKEAVKRWYNGMLGRVTAMNAIHVVVEAEDGSIINVDRNEWKSYEYIMSAGKIEQKETGSYVQFPLTLGYAITIHKSQGKTLSNLHVDMGYGAFATGQTYVALSRATSPDGLSLERPIKPSDIKCCPIVYDFFHKEKVFELT